MASRLLTRFILNSNSRNLKFSALQIRNLQTEIAVKEVKIPVQYGHIAAKLWGSGQGRPILALHGWQDNAGTWDTLIPMIIKDRPILAIDFPGHGQSSWIPKGLNYYAWELPRTILYLKEHFKWDKVSLLCHSMGSISGMRYSCLYPDDVDFYIAIDSLIYDDFDLNLVIDKYPTTMSKGLVAQSRLETEPPSYSLEEIKQIWHRGTFKSVAVENVQYLLNRGAKQSSQDSSKYYFCRDSRLKYTLFNPEDKKFVSNLVMRLKCPTLYFKAKDSQYSSDNFSIEMRELIEKTNPKFEVQHIPGTHHVHLNNPELLAPAIKDFVQRHNLSL